MHNQSEYNQNDEISMVDIFIVILRRKKIIIAVAVSILMVAFIYILLAKKIYQVNTIISPPLLKNINALSVVSDSNADSPVREPLVFENHEQEIFINVAKKIESRNFIREYFNKKNIFEILAEKSKINISKQQAFEDFFKRLKVRKDGNIVVVSMEGVEKENLGVWVDEIVNNASEETVKEFAKNVQSKIKLRLQQVNVDIANKRFMYKQQVEDEITRLEEAYQIANKLKIDMPLVTQFSHAYLKGTRAIRTEINALKKRTTNDPFIDDLRPLQKEQQTLEQLEKQIPNELNFSAVNIDKRATEAIDVISPKQGLILKLAVALAIILGVFSAFIAEFVAKLRKRVNLT